MSDNKQLVLSYSPHEKGEFTVNNLMWGVIIALIPTTLVGFYFFGIAAVKVTLMAVLVCVATEWFLQKYVLNTRVTAFDGSAIISGLLLAYNVPSNIPLWMIVAGGIFTIAIAKQAFGGLGKNPVNPALAGRIFLLACFPVEMTTWPIPGKNLLEWAYPVIKVGPDATTAATTLGLLKEGIKSGESVSQIIGNDPHGYFNYWNLFIGNIGGCIGEVSAAAILLGGVYMIYKKIITWHIPVFYIGTVFVFMAIFNQVNPERYADPMIHILAGGLFLGAFFMATDYVTSPMTIKGQIIYAIGCGLLLSTIRLWGGYPEGCSFSILIMNCFVPLINKYVKPKRFGEVAKNVA